MNATNPNNAAIAAIAAAVADHMLHADNLAVAAREAASAGRINEAAGALLGLQDLLAQVQQTVGAALVLHRMNAGR